MKLDTLMTRNVEVIHPDSNLMEAAKLMQKYDIGSLPVCEGDRLVGMLTDRDIVVRGIAQNKDYLKTCVKEVMTTPIVYCYEDQEAEEVARVMEVKKIRRVVVLNRKKRMVGIASLDNLAESQAIAGEILARLTHRIHSEAA